MIPSVYSLSLQGGMISPRQQTRRPPSCTRHRRVFLSWHLSCQLLRRRYRGHCSRNCYRHLACCVRGLVILLRPHLSKIHTLPSGVTRVIPFICITAHRASSRGGIVAELLLQHSKGGPKDSQEQPLERIGHIWTGLPVEDVAGEECQRRHGTHSVNAQLLEADLPQSIDKRLDGRLSLVLSRQTSNQTVQKRLLVGDRRLVIVVMHIATPQRRRQRPEVPQLQLGPELSGPQQHRARPLLVLVEEGPHDVSTLAA
mmetsp:Transcript_10615/g.30656  ORF Transcript_10615/g.30656 Transcript_10615/m.30656 type:complete len:256 (+) Transcript_10615:1662-2429(+)